MAVVRYRVDGVPEAWADAFFITPGLTPAGRFSTRWSIQAAWGTESVPSPAPAGRGTLTNSPEWRPPSSVAPDAFLPQVAVQDIRDFKPAGGTVKWYPSRYATPPVPVGRINYPPPPVKMRGRKVGGRRSMHWPRTITRWPGLFPGAPR